MGARFATARVGKTRARERNCSVARTLGILSDPWAFLVIREAFFRKRRFKDFQDTLGIPRGTLTDRLRRLTRDGIFTRLRYQRFPDRFEYRLTDKGLDLYPSFVALMKWGDRWLARGRPPLKLIHRGCGNPVEARTVCSECGGEIKPYQVSYRDGPGAGSSIVPASGRIRRAAQAANFLRGRRCSVARTLRIIGDRWSFLVMREAFFGVRRYDEMHAKLNIATNILADRLRRLVEEGIFARTPYQDRPPRFEYRFTGEGRELYDSMIAMMRWGDRWASPDGAPLILTHRGCGADFHAVVACNHCGGELAAREMSYAGAAAVRNEAEVAKPRVRRSAKRVGRPARAL